MVRVGDLLGVALPGAVIESLGVNEGDYVQIQIAADSGLSLASPRNVAAVMDSWEPLNVGVDPDDITRAIREDRGT
ncbi:MAG: AbrB/MazE/SpoVT family DNA-binding domain-containing protein [Candidatus Dormibacteria bacterium]